MMWTYEIESGDLLVYDHNDELVRTVTNDGSGFGFPDSVLAVMGEELDARGWDFNDSWVQETMKAALIENIEAR